MRTLLWRVAVARRAPVVDRAAVTLDALASAATPVEWLETLAGLQMRVIAQTKGPVRPADHRSGPGGPGGRTGPVPGSRWTVRECGGAVMRWSPTSTKGRGCDRKVRHATKAAAITEMRRLVSLGTAWSRLNVYRCKFCECWHIGHRGRRAMQR